MTSKHTVLQILPRLVTGGVERGTVEVTAALAAAGWNAIVASEGGPMVQEITRAGGKHIALPLATKNPVKMWQNIKRLSEIIDRNNVDIVHARSRAPAWSAYYAARRTGQHFITTFHNAYGSQSWCKRRYNAVMAKGERVIAISNFVAAYAEKLYRVPADRLRTIPRGVDIEQFDAQQLHAARLKKLKQEWQITNDKRPLILLPGRLTRWKGQQIFIDAVAQLKRTDILCLIVGSGKRDYRKALKNEIKRRGLEDVIRLVDECGDMPAAFALADIVVSASTRPEGFGRVIIEAQAMGCLVIATAHGGAAETINDGENGWLIPPGNSKKLAETLTTTLALTAPKRRKIGKQAIAHIRGNFTTALMTQRTLAVYEEILKKS